MDALSGRVDAVGDCALLLESVKFGLLRSEELIFTLSVLQSVNVFNRYDDGFLARVVHDLQLQMIQIRICVELSGVEELDVNGFCPLRNGVVLWAEGVGVAY